MAKGLPVWFDELNNINYKLPKQLEGLREGEKLLLQQISPYVHLQHLSKDHMVTRVMFVASHKI